MKNIRLELFYFYRNFGFAWDANLTQTTAISIKAKLGVDKRSCFKINVLLTLDLVVSFFCYSANRAAINALPTDSL